MNRVVLLCSDGLTSRLVAQATSKHGMLEAILLAERKGFIRRIGWRLRRLGFSITVSQIGCGVIARVMYYVKGGHARYREILGQIGLPDRWPNGIPLSHFPSVNHVSVARALRSLSPDIVVINGTDIIKKEILGSVDARFINIHCGLTPDYRGVHGAFWAIWERRPERIGVTLHEVDKNVDTGRIIAQVQITYDRKRDGFLTLPLLQYQSALPILEDYLRSGTGKGALPGAGSSRQWYYPNLSAYTQVIARGDLRY